MPRMWDRIDFSTWECNSGKGWGDWCEGIKVIEANPGWQACRFLFQETFKNGIASMNYQKDRYFENDPQKPARFRAYSVRLFSEYDELHNIEGKIHLAQVGIRMIPADATQEQRFAAGCDM